MTIKILPLVPSDTLSGISLAQKRSQRWDEGRFCRIFKIFLPNFCLTLICFPFYGVTVPK